MTSTIAPSDDRPNEGGTGDSNIDIQEANNNNSSHNLPPRPDDIDQRQRQIDLRKFGEELQVAANAAFPNTNTSRYQKVYVLILKWEDEDPKLPVSYEISKLEGVFKDVYHFQTESWDIPDEDCHDKVNQKILDFKRLGENSKDDLKIIYYAGHGKLTRNRALSWTSWRNNQELRCPCVKWSGIQNVVEEAQSDFLLLLDCCSSGTSNTNEGRGITELISACDYRSTANGVGPFSFTHALVTELLHLARRESFSVLELYNNVFFRVQGRIPEDGRERHPAPIHLVLTNDTWSRQSIQLSKFTDNNLCEPIQPDLEIVVSPFEGDISQHKIPDSEGPRIALAIRLSDNFSVEQLSVARFTEWLQAIPIVAEHVRIEAGFSKIPSVLILSMPVSLSRYLPGDTVSTNFVTTPSNGSIPSKVETAISGLYLSEQSFRLSDQEAAKESYPISLTSTHSSPETSSPNPVDRLKTDSELVPLAPLCERYDDSDGLVLSEIPIRQTDKALLPPHSSVRVEEQIEPEVVTDLALLHNRKMATSIFNSDLDGVSKLQDIWDESMKDVQSSGKLHRHVAVLMISWAPQLDDLHTREEVDALAEVFTDMFSYTVIKRQLDDGRLRPALQLSKFLADFVFSHDNDSTLLIVYYAGHGIPGNPGELTLAGSRSSGRGNTQRNSLIWHEAENIVKNSESDILLIFDCCYAGNLVTQSTRGFSNRSFEFLGACGSSGETHRPGESSFTSALIWALKTLVQSHSSFSTQELRRSIMHNAPNFPPGQIVPLLERDQRSMTSLVLRPLRGSSGTGSSKSFIQPSDPKATASDEYLDLRFWYSQHPTEEEILTLAQGLKSLMRDEGISAHRITWVGLQTRSKDLTQISKEKWKWLARRPAPEKLMSETTSFLNSVHLPPSPEEGKQIVVLDEEPHEDPKIQPLSVSGRASLGLGWNWTISFSMWEPHVATALSIIILSVSGYMFLIHFELFLPDAMESCRD